MIIYFNRFDKFLLVKLLFILLILFLVGCAGSSVYVREDNVTKTINYSDTDLKILAEKMVMSLLQSPFVTNRPKIWVSDVQNRTSEYIDTQGILDKISVALIKSGQVRLVEREAVKKIAAEKMLVDMQRIDVEDAVKLGQVAGADYVLLGNLMSIEHKDEGFWSEDRMVYYKFTMRLIGMDSEILWMDEKEIKKTTDKSKF